jgi:hypothetical protein
MTKSQYFMTQRSERINYARTVTPCGLRRHTRAVITASTEETLQRGLSKHFKENVCGLELFGAPIYGQGLDSKELNDETGND